MAKKKVEVSEESSIGDDFAGGEEAEEAEISEESSKEKGGTGKESRSRCKEGRCRKSEESKEGGIKSV